jgi:hypothetical protein
VSRRQVEEIGRRFFEAIWSRRTVSPETLLFDTTNYFGISLIVKTSPPLKLSCNLSTTSLWSILASPFFVTIANVPMVILHSRPWTHG